MTSYREAMAQPRVGESVFALNPKYKDGTRLRAKPSDDSPFNGIWVPNDTKLLVVDVAAGYVLVRKADGDQGWMRDRNITLVGRVAGVTKGVVSNEIVTPDPEYVKGIRIYGVGIKEDPVPGQKFGKGIQHLISSHWLLKMSQFVATYFSALQAFACHANEVSKRYPGYDYVYFANYANHLFEKAAILGLKSQDSIDQFLMATWLVMAAAEVDDFPIRKWTPAQRKQQRLDFYQMYLNPRAGPGVVDAPQDDASALGKFAAPISRRDLLPPVAMERLGLNNELSGLKYSDPELPLREGFLVSARIDSLKRHFDSVHRRLTDEDHVIHLLWNFMAIYHVTVVFPEKNNLIDYSSVHGPRVPRAPYDPTTSLEKISHSSLPLSSVLKLDWNEGAIPPPPRVSEALIAFVKAAEGSLLKWYPHLAGGEELRKALAEYCGVIPENLLVTNGSDDALILVCHAFLGNDKSALVPVPTYEHFCVNAVCTGASLIRLDLADPFAPTPAAISTAIELHHPQVVYLVSPNNPTGSQWSEESVRALALRYSEVLFLVDEAYYEFGSIDPATKKPMTCVRLATELTNVIVTRTFSKAFCLAALRCGYLIAHPNTIEKLRAYYNPKSVNQFAQIAAVHALKEVATYYKPYIESTNEARNNFLRALQVRGVSARCGGGGNFVCVQVPGKGATAELCKHLESKAIYVRDISSRFPGYIRITIGLEMTRVVDEIVSALQTMGVLAPAPAPAAKLAPAP